MTVYKFGVDYSAVSQNPTKPVTVTGSIAIEKRDYGGTHFGYTLVMLAFTK
jgi:hypothetical protein